MSNWRPDAESLQRALERAYEVALDGFPGVESVDDLASSYRSRPGSARKQAESLVRWQIAKAGTSGFLAGLGGIVTLPVAVPVNLASVLFVQARMVAAVATLAGLNPRDDQVRTLVYVCMTGKAAFKLVEGTGLVVGEKLAVRGIESISGATLKAINQKVGFRLATKFGEKGVVNLGKLVPLVGGVLGAAFDGISTKVVGATAISIFHPLQSGAEL